jgi:hypothetical protein
MITIKIKTDNAAFEDDSKMQVTHTLSKVIDRLKRGEIISDIPIMDGNGNTCGTITTTGKDREGYQ